MAKTRQRRKVKKLRIKRILTILILIICLIVIYRFNFSTKSEVVSTAKIKFKERDIDNLAEVDIELFKDEEGKEYIVLPDKVNGCFVEKYYVDNSIEKSADVENQVSNENITNDVENNETTPTSTNTSNADANTIVENNNTSNTTTNTVISKSSLNETKEISAVQAIKSPKSTSNEKEVKNEETENVTNTEKVTNESIDNNSNTVKESNSKEETEVQNKVNENTTVLNENKVEENKTTQNTNQVTEAQNENVTKTDNTTVSDENVVANEVVTDEKIDTIENTSMQAYLPGQKLYLNNFENEIPEIEVEYQTTTVKEERLYNQELEINISNYIVKVMGYMPLGYHLENGENAEQLIQNYINGVEDFENSQVLLAYDISITDGTKEFQPKEYNQNVQVSITSAEELNGKLNGNLVGVVDVKETEEEILLEKVYLDEKTDDTVKFVINEFTEVAALIEYATITPEVVTIDDYQSDYDYYMGRNYTENFSGTNQNLYNDNNLAKVTVNYYGYDYNTDLNEERPLAITNYTLSGRDTYNPGRNNRERYFRVTLQIDTGNKLVEENKNWKVTFSVPEVFSLDGSIYYNNNYFRLNNVQYTYSEEDGTATLSGEDFSEWRVEGPHSYQLGFAIAINIANNDDDINNLTNYVDITEISAIERTSIVGHVSNTDRQSLFTYIKCVPIVNGNISLELIDNPYMDRPYKFGFDGWKTHEAGYNISINNDTKVQTLTTSANGSKEITLNLYANWQEANVVFVNLSQTNADTNGLSIKYAYNSFQNAANALLDNEKSASNASNRELNIVVLVNGTENNFNYLINTNRAFTLTSLYNGVDYRNQSAVSIRTNYTLNADLQLDFLNITNNNNYRSDTVTGTINYYLIGNARNLRIGRGMVPLNVGTNTTTFAQIQGGPNTNTNPNRSYKMVIETGKYANIQTSRTESRTYTADAILVLGNDFDRANGQNNNDLHVFNRVASKSGAGTNTAKSSGYSFIMDVKSGSIGMDNFTERGEDYAFSGIYIGGHTSGYDNNDRIITVEGGNIANILGGLGIPNGSAVKTYIYVKGGTVQNIVGGAGVSTTYGDRAIQVTDATIAYSVSGGSNGYTAGTTSSANPTGELVGNTLLYIGQNAVIGDNPIDDTLYDVRAGNVLGAGNGNDILPDTAGKVQSTHIIIDGNAHIKNNVYGGGNFGQVGNPINSNTPLISTQRHTNITSGTTYLISNGTTSGTSRLLNANGNNINSTTFQTTRIPTEAEQWIITSSGNGYTIQNASTKRYLHANGTTLELSQTPSTFTYSNNRFTTNTNGRNYYLRYQNNSWTLNRNNSTTIYLLTFTELPVPDVGELATKSKIEILGGTIDYDVYGGSNQNAINGSTEIIMKDGTINGACYGGSNTSGTVQGTSKIDIQGGTIGTIGTSSDVLFVGGKGENTTVLQGGTANVKDIDEDVYLYGNVYGGSALGYVAGKSFLNILDNQSDTYSIFINGNIYGGGKGDTETSARNRNDATVTVDGGTYSTTKVFGGCNVNGTIAGNVLVKIGENYETAVNEVYGGGNQASLTDVTKSDYVYVYKNATVDNAFNGGNSAGIDGDNTVTPRAIYITGAKVGNVYGGSNATGTLTETHVYCSDGANIENIYGAGFGSDTTVSGDTNVSITSTDATTTITNNVYGGGNQGIVEGSTNIDISSSAVNGCVYGGGEKANVDTDTNVKIDSSQVKEVFGGGNEGEVGQNTDVDILNSTTATTVYGGGRSASVAGDTDVCVDASNVDDVYGGGQGETASVTNTNVQLLNSATINNNVYGGGDQGEVTEDVMIIEDQSKVEDTIYGGGNRANVNGNVNVRVIDNSTAKFVYGGGNEGEVKQNTTVMITEKSNISDTVYGGGNKGAVEGNAKVTVDDSNITNTVYGGGKSANVLSTEVNIQNNSMTNYVFGGGDQGEVIENTNVTINHSQVMQDAFGGGNGATTLEGETIPGKVGLNANIFITSNSEIHGRAFGGGRGVTALVDGNTLFNLSASTVDNDIYGGGDNGSVRGSTNVAVTSSIVGGNAYAAGNGANAIVSGNSYIFSQGDTQILKSIFGGGNAAPTGYEDYLASYGIVEIAGGIIGGNVYGGANSSVIYGDTIVNIGIEAIDTYHGEETGYLKGKIDIAGTVFGGGESMDPTKDFSYDSISVTGTITINVDGLGYDNDNINIAESIFGSGNASSANTNGDIFIRNYGTLDNPKKGVSIQRASNVVLDNANIWLSGTTDSTSTHATTYFTLNRIGALKIKNNTTMYLRNGANLLESFYSLYGPDDNEQYNTVTVNNKITDSNGKTYNAKGDKVFSGDTVEYYMSDGAMYNAAGEKIADVTSIETQSIDKDTDNRVYMYSGINLNISPSENLESYGEVKGMTFFGIYKNSSNETESGDPDDLSGIYTGIYDKDYQLGNKINWNDRDFNRAYAVGLHQTNPEQDIQKDGFYTNYEKLGPEYGPNDIIEEETYNATSYCNYITPTPANDIYYMWYAGPDVEIYYYTFSLFASKFSTLGTHELSLLGLSFPNATLKMHSVDSSLEDGVGLYDKNEIPNVNPDQDAANNNFGLTMKTGNSGWSLNGETDFYAESDGSGASYNGTETYTIENSSTTPSFSFYFYHSNNITEEKELGYYTITMDLSYWKDSLNQGRATVIIDILLGTVVYDDLGYNGAITPGTQYDLFTSTETNITTKSSFSAYFELAQSEFKQNEIVQRLYDNSYRVITTEYVFPENTTITMIDSYDDNNPEYYYYTVTAEDTASGKNEYRLSDFKAMGSTDEPYDEKTMREKYYLEDLDYEYECFIFIVNFESAKFGPTTDPNNMITRNQHFRIALKSDEEEKPLFGLLDDQIDSTTFGIYDTESLIKIDANLSKQKIYLGNSVNLNVNTNYEVTLIDSVRVYDTQYFDKKLGVKLSFYNAETDEIISGSSLLGTYFELDGTNYYPRTDGTTRIKIAEKVSNASSSITIHTDNSSLASGKYYILIESFGSADGIYFGIKASDSTQVDLEIINGIYGLESSIPEEQVIVDKDTGHTLEKDTGYISDTNNTIDVSLKYQSGLSSPYITVSLYRRDYEDVYDMTYGIVDLADYVQEPLELLDEENIELEYNLLTAEDIDNQVDDVTQESTFNFKYTLKDNLVTGTYKLVFTLYDKNKTIQNVVVEDENGDLVETGDTEEVIDYEYIGDTFSYIIIK